MAKRRTTVLLLLALLLVPVTSCGGPGAGPAPTATKTPRPTFTDVPPATNTPTVMPTPLPTETPVPPTATATFTPEPTATRRPATAPLRPPTATPAPQVGPHGVLGRLRTRDGRSEYAVNEQVFFTFEIENHTDADIRFGIIGLKADQNVPFQTSWTSDVYDHKFPAKQTFKNDDRIIFTAPGTYTVRLAICFSRFGECQGGGAEWEEFSPVVVHIR